MHWFIETGDEASVQAIATSERDMSRSLNDAQQNATTDAIRQAIDGVRHNHDQFFAEFDDAMSDNDAGKDRQKIMHTIVQKITTDVLTPADELLKRTQHAVDQHSKRNQSIANAIGWGLLLLGVCGAVAGLMAGFAIARWIASRIEQTEREATRAEQLASIGQLAAGLAHELRNPLTAMQVLVEATREPSANGGLDQRDLEVLDEEIGRMNQLVTSFLEFARPPRLETAVIDIRRLVQQTLQLVGGRVRQRGITIDPQLGPQPVEIRADPVQLRQVVLNLLLNAIDAVGENGQVFVAVNEDGHAAGANGTRKLHSRFAAISVADNGPGVPNELRERIFQPFVSTKETGMGLGLAVCRRIVEAHAGEISISANPGGGARFTVWLPITHNNERFKS